MLRAALALIEKQDRQAEAAEAQLERARALQAAKAMPRLVRQAFADALDRAESSRRVLLVRTASEELRAFDKEAYWRHAFRRVRGRGIPEDTTSLAAGASEVATALFLNLRGFVGFTQGLDAEEVLLALNQLLADLAAALDRHRTEVVSYLGGGFIALARETGHAHRAVSAALDMLAVVTEFNRPRELLGLRLLPAEIGIASGPVFLGNIGTYRKMTFTAVGPAVNLAARLMRQSDKSLNAPCISRETYELVRDRFVFHPDSPRTIELKDLGRREVWDVIGRSAERSSGSSRIGATASPRP
jgi:class 3 adenylate cyclase